MQKIKSNLGAIQHKFQSLKKTHTQYEQPTSIGEVAEVMTYGVVTSNQVQDFLAYVHSNQQIQQQQKINENWFQLNIKQMILFLDKVIKHRNIIQLNSNEKKVQKQRLNIGNFKIKKRRKRQCQHHKNKEEINNQNKQNQENQPRKKYKKVLTKKIDENGNQYEIEQLIEGEGEGFQELIQNQVTEDKSQSQSQEQILDKQNVIGNNKKYQSQNNQTIGQILNLGQDFKQLSIQQRHQILLQKYEEAKQSLQFKFGKIYKHYRKQMYIPNESFQKNTDLMIDMRIFLKYYRDFQMSKYYGVNIASNLFKKIAINGLWLDFKKFIDIHYQILQLLEIINLQQPESQSIIKDKKYKKQIGQSIKALMKNLVKLKGLAKIVSNQKLNKILNKNQSDGSLLKKIVQVHTGFVKEDVILKLNQRIMQRKMKKQRIHQYQRLSGIDTESYSPQKSSPLKRLPGQLSFMKSVYTQLQLPKLRSRQLKKSSVYSSLEQLHIHKQRQKLRNMINQEQQQKYLDIYFEKQKKNKLKKSSSSILVGSNKSFKTDISKKLSLKSSQAQYALALPKMKFK